MWPFEFSEKMDLRRGVRVDGFREKVPGLIFDGSKLEQGVPLGGLGTGYFTLDGSGKIGKGSIYNNIVPPRTWNSDWLTVSISGKKYPLSQAEIAYWGHFPVADLRARFDSIPLELGIRAFSPFILGRSAESNIPAALFEIEIENCAQERRALSLLITPPERGKKSKADTTLVGDQIRVTGDQEIQGRTELTLAPGEKRKLRFVFAWFAPHWRDSGSEAHVHRYGQRFDDADAVAEYAWRRFDHLRDAVFRWQSAIYQTNWPDWLRDALIQSFYSLTKNTIWIARTRHDEWWSDEGWFTHNESHTGCPITETMVCRMHGHFPLLFFFPELERTTLDAFRHFQIRDGEIPFSYGMGTSMRDPRYHCQHPLNSGQYAQMVYQLYLRAGDRDLLEYFYDSAKRAIRYQYSLDDDQIGLVSDQAHVSPGEFWPANQFYDIWPWWGSSAYVAGTWLATLACGRAMAEVVQDEAFRLECDRRLQRAVRSYEERLWTGEYYRLWNDPAHGRRSNASLGNQLMGDWCLRVAGLPSVLPEEHIRSALASVERLNRPPASAGLINGVEPDGTPVVTGYGGGNDHARHTFVGETLCAAMTFLYHGKPDVGLAIAHELYQAIMLKACSPWNQRCLISGETGLPVWGDDYYSDLVIWAFPMAMEGWGIWKFTSANNPIDRIISAE